MSDMFIDTDTFDFNMITDIIDEHGNKFNVNDVQPNRVRPQREPRTAHDLMIDDASDLFGDSVPDLNDDNYPDFNEDASDLERPVNPDDSIRITDYFNSAPDDAVLTVGNWEGTKAELAEKIKKVEKAERDADYFGNSRDIIEADREAVLKSGLMKQSILEQNITRLNNRLQQPLTDAEFKSTIQDREVAIAALQNLHIETNQAWAKIQQNEAITNYNRMYIADTQLDNEIPNWSKYQPHVREYAKSLNIPDSVYEKIYDVGIAKAFFKAYMYDQNKARVAESLKSKQTAVNPRSTKSARNTQVSDTEAAKAKQALARMGSGRDANVKAFAYIKD